MKNIWHTPVSFSSSSEDLSMFAAAEEVRKKQLFVFQGEGGGVGLVGVLQSIVVKI